MGNQGYRPWSREVSCYRRSLEKAACNRARCEHIRIRGRNNRFGSRQYLRKSLSLPTNSLRHHAKPNSRGYDGEATIKTLKPFKEGLDRPLVEKQQALENVDVIVAKYPKLLKDEFDLDADVVRRVERVKALTDMIVRYDRKKSGQASEGRRQSKCIYTLRCHY